MFFCPNRKFAPRCSVCVEPIMPAPGQEETVRIVALDRDFHVQCYRCEVRECNSRRQLCLNWGPEVLLISLDPYFQVTVLHTHLQTCMYTHKHTHTHTQIPAWWLTAVLAPLLFSLLAPNLLDCQIDNTLHTEMPRYLSWNTERPRYPLIVLVSVYYVPRKPPYWCSCCCYHALPGRHYTHTHTHAGLDAFRQTNIDIHKPTGILTYAHTHTHTQYIMLKQTAESS